MIKIVTNDQIHYADDNRNPFLLFCTLQETKTAPALAARFNQQGLRITFNPAEGFNVLAANGQKLSCYNFMSHVHGTCGDIITQDRFFSEDMQDNQLRVLRACAMAAKVPLSYG